MDVLKEISTSYPLHKEILEIIMGFEDESMRDLIYLLYCEVRITRVFKVK